MLTGRFAVRMSGNETGVGLARHAFGQRDVLAWLSFVIVALFALCLSSVSAEAAPFISNVLPSSGDAGGGETVVLSGSGFTGATAVTMGGRAVSGFSVDNDGQVTLTTPPGVVGTVDVTVTSASGSDTAVGGFTYTSFLSAPLITGASPSSGTTLGGTRVTLTGYGFSFADGVNFGTQPAASYTIVSDAEIIAVTPATSASLVDIEITSGGGATDLTSFFTFDAAAPSLASIAPASGSTAGGTMVTITGANFAGPATVSFGGVAATSVTVVSATEITATAPAHSQGAVDVAVTTSVGTETLYNSFTYVPPAALIFSPASGTLPQAMEAEAYSVTVSATGGTGTLLYSIDSGALPPGMILNATTGELTGPLDPNTAGNYVFFIKVQDSGGGSATAEYRLTVVQRAVTVTDKVRNVPPGSAPPPVSLTAGATGGPFVDATATFVEPPNAGTVEVLQGVVAQSGGGTTTGWYIRFTPTPGFTGQARIGFRLTSALGVSNAGTVTLNFGYAPEQVVAEIHAAVQGFVQSRLAMIASTIKVPGLIERRAMGSANSPATARITPSETGVMTQLSTSLAQMDAARLGDAGVIAADPLLFNAWVDATVMLHNRAQNGSAWGNFAIVSAGFDYLFNDKTLVGLAFHYDRMSDPIGSTTALSGNGWLAGPYASLEVIDGVFWDTSLFYGMSSNRVDMISWDGDFNTQRWLFDTQIAGQWQIDEATVLTPRLRLVYLSETIEGYAITNAAGDVLSIQGFSTEQLRLSIGGDIAHTLYLDNGRALTPKLAIDLGVAPLSGFETFASISPGFSLGLPNAWSLDAGLIFNFDRTGSTSIGAKAGIRGGF